MNGRPGAVSPVMLETPLTTIERARFDAAKAALQGLLAAGPAATQSTSNADQVATRAVRYADALLEALNRTHQEATAHARRR